MEAATEWTLLHSALMENGGVLDYVIFVPDTDSLPELDWLLGLVTNIDQYRLLPWKLAQHRTQI